MKKIFYFIAAALALTAVSCQQNKGPVTAPVSVQLILDGEALAEEGITITLSGGGSVYDAETDASGVASFKLPVGVYSATTSFKKSDKGILYNYNGNAEVTVDKAEEVIAELSLTPSKTSQLIIKELYNGGCKQNNGTSNYINDKYIIIYNNSDTEVDASRMCLTMAQIVNTQSLNKYTITDGVKEYEAAGWTPANYGIWWFKSGTQVKIAPYSQITIAITGAIDHTATYTNSVDLSGVDYCLYHPESGFNGAAQYPAPSASIPESNYMQTYEFGQGTAWAMPLNNAAPYLIIPDEDVDITQWVKDEANFDNRGTNKSSNYAMVPTGWILDALEEWSAADETKFFVRFPSAVNTGYNVMNNGWGYTQYRNVDKTATEAIAENEGKLVYGYDGAVDNENDGDPSGIDAEASIANGAKIVYMDTNNSANDFHQRKVASLKK